MKHQHPGIFLQDFFLKGMSLLEASVGSGLPMGTLLALGEGRLSITPEIAVKLAKYTNTAAISWLTRQFEYDLQECQQMERESHETSNPWTPSF